jgi:cysteinyl-tRNA synthetase
MSGTELRIYNTLTRSKEPFRPIDPDNVRMYVCGPTVYDFAHIGNARPAIVFDVLFRLLRHLYGEEHVTYVRNITDVDDKINARALRDFGGEIASGTLSLNDAIRRVTETTYNQYQKDVAALGCLKPTHEPRATEFVLPRTDGKADMVTLIQNLIDRGHAYVAAGEVLFDTESMADYGQLSKRRLDEQQAGARVEVDVHKKNPGDFVLWKESSAEEPGWNASFRLPNAEIATIRGRPGWHIECSAMSAAYLGDVFDIHGGGLDLIFPHHENEIAQSRCAHGTEVMANYWMHNGFLQVEGRKMSKSEGNFVTIHELLETEKFGGRKWPGEVLRLAMLMTHYREPIDFSVRRLEEAENTLRRFGKLRRKAEDRDWKSFAVAMSQPVPADAVLSNLSDDLNMPTAIQTLQTMARVAEMNRERDKYVDLRILATLEFLGVDIRRYTIDLQLPPTEEAEVKELVSRRLAFIREKNWAEADRIREELLLQGIQLKDGKDPATGERITTWEVKR